MSDEIINKKPTIDVLISESLYQLSLSDLIERIEFLENEIDRCKKEINNKNYRKI